MDNKVVLDSCVFNKLFLQEPETDNAIAIINHLTAKAYQILAPSLFLYEVLAVAKISKVDTQQIYAIIVKLQNLGLQLIELNSEMIEKALSICDVGHDKSGFPSFYDASYHALAMLNACYFVTADKRLSINIQKFPPVNTEKFPVGYLKSMLFSRLFTLLKPIRIITSFQNIAMMGNSI